MDVGWANEDGGGGEDSKADDESEDQQGHARAEVLERDPETEDGH